MDDIYHFLIGVFVMFFGSVLVIYEYSIRPLRDRVRGLEQDARMMRKRRVMEAIGDMIRPEFREQFFEMPHALLGGKRPIDLLATEEGTMKVIRLLKGAESGSFP